MGFIGKIFGAIFGFIGGLFGSIAKVFGLGGKSDYYLEIDSTQGASSPDAKPSATPEPKAPEAATAAPSVASAAPVAAPAEPPAQPAGLATAPAAPAATPAVATASPASQNGKSASNVTFAPDNLLTLGSTGGRRRPGPSLSPFKDMAREVQRPTKA